MIVVLDASALCALIFDEKGAAKVEALLPDAVIDATLADLGLTVVSFDSEQATLAGKLRGATKAFNVSLGDRACLALAIHRKCPAVTGDHAWKEFAKQVGVKLELFR